MAYGLPAITYDGVIRSRDAYRSTTLPKKPFGASMKMAAAEGAGLGMGGMFTVLPDLGILAAITMRMIQKLSLMYGFPYNTEEEEAELWVAAASAAGVDIGREIGREAGGFEVCAAGDPAHRRTDQRRDRREMDGPTHPGRQRRNRCRPELLFRACLGRTRPGTLPPAASCRASATRASGADSAAGSRAHRKKPGHHRGTETERFFG